ncbi:MAG: hypothetical protein ABIX09_01495 [Terrimesophilobacter sp.]
MGFLFEAFVGGVACEGTVGSIVVVVVLSLLEFVAEQVDVVDDLAFQESVEVFGADSVGSFNLAVESWCGRFDIDVADAFAEQVPVEDLPEFFAVVDSCVLVVAFLATSLAQRFDELHINLQRMPWALFLVKFPAGLLHRIFSITSADFLDMPQNRELVFRSALELPLGRRREV